MQHISMPVAELIEAIWYMANDHYYVITYIIFNERASLESTNTVRMTESAKGSDKQIEKAY